MTPEPPLSIVSRLLPVLRSVPFLLGKLTRQLPLSPDPFVRRIFRARNVFAANLVNARSSPPKAPKTCPTTTTTATTPVNYDFLWLFQPRVSSSPFFLRQNSPTKRAVPRGELSVANREKSNVSAAARDRRRRVRLIFNRRISTLPRRSVQLLSSRGEVSERYVFLARRCLFSRRRSSKRESRSREETSDWL